MSCSQISLFEEAADRRRVETGRRVRLADRRTERRLADSRLKSGMWIQLMFVDNVGSWSYKCRQAPGFT